MRCECRHAMPLSTGREETEHDPCSQRLCVVTNETQRPTKVQYCQTHRTELKSWAVMHPSDTHVRVLPEQGVQTRRGRGGEFPRDGTVV